MFSGSIFFWMVVVGCVYNGWWWLVNLSGGWLILGGCGFAIMVSYSGGGQWVAVVNCIYLFLYSRNFFRLF